MFWLISNHPKRMKIKAKTFYVSGKVTIFCCDGIVADMVLYVSNMGQYRVHWKEHEQHDDGTTTVSVYDKPFVGFHEAHRFATARLSNRFDPTVGRITTRFSERDIEDPTPSYLDDVEFDFVV